MRFRVRAKVEGFARIPSTPFSVAYPPYVLQFEADESRAVTGLSVERRVEVYKHLLPTLAVAADGSSSPKYPDNPIHGEILSVLQYLESVGSFWLGISEIGWEHADFDWVPESDAEREELVVWDLRVNQRYPEEFFEIDRIGVQVLMQRLPMHERLTVPLAFYREGKNEFRRFRYVQAFMNFYFMIEGLFGRGRPNYRVKEEFKAAPTLVNAAEAAARVIAASTRHVDRLRLLVCDSVGTIEGSRVLEWLVDLRGIVHHYSINDSRPQAHPHNQREFEAAAFLAMAVCVKLMPFLISDGEIPIDVAQ